VTSGSYSAAMLVPIAHAGHWYFWPLYAAPIFVVLWSVVRATINERREEEKRGSEGSDPDG
jgi:hypothetical protein